MLKKDELIARDKFLTEDLSNNKLNVKYTITGKVYASILKSHQNTLDSHIEALNEIESLKKQLSHKPRIVYKVR